MQKRQKYQHGVALFVVIVIVMLSMLLALSASRTSWFGEMLVGNDADYQRAFEAAQAMIQDAELDIRGEQSNGDPCKSVANDSNICRAGNTVWFIDEEQELGNLINTLDAQTTKCLQGICQKRGDKQDFWKDATTLAAMTADGVGARYGTYTGAKTGSNSNPILNMQDAGKGAWYWVEVMPYDINPGAGLINQDTSATNANKSKWELSLKPPIVYRITAIARGLKPSTQVVLQSTFARQKLKD